MMSTSIRLRRAGLLGGLLALALALPADARARHAAAAPESDDVARNGIDIVIDDAVLVSTDEHGHVVQQGLASWYGGRHNGRRTASGTRFDMHEMTAAHASLPLGTRVRVVRVDTGDAVIVTITDRIGTHRRVIDLSRTAAVALNMIGPGVAQVRIEVLES
jgi:rare lipoprotein A